MDTLTSSLDPRQDNRRRPRTRLWSRVPQNIRRNCPEYRLCRYLGRDNRLCHRNHRCLRVHSDTCRSRREHRHHPYRRRQDNRRRP